MRDLTFKPALHVRIAFVVLFLGVGLITLAGIKDIPPSGIGDYFILALTLACVYAAITYPMRAVTFTGGSVRVRSLGGWKTIPLPPKVRVGPGLSIGSVYVADARDDVVFLVLKREFGSPSEMQASIKAWLRRENRLAD